MSEKDNKVESNSSSSSDEDEDEEMVGEIENDKRDTSFDSNEKEENDDLEKVQKTKSPRSRLANKTPKSRTSIKSRKKSSPTGPVTRSQSTKLSSSLTTSKKLPIKKISLITPSTPPQRTRLKRRNSATSYLSPLTKKVKVRSFFYF